MSWLEITLNTAPERIDSLCAALTARGFADLVIEDQQEFETFLEENRAYWDYIDESLQERLQGLSQVKLYLEDSDKAGLARLEQAARELELPMTLAPLAETDWEESWKENYPPQEIGQTLVVVPYWLADQPTDRKPVILDPGLTFGTGAHPSTQMVMEAMERVDIASRWKHHPSEMSGGQQQRVAIARAISTRPPIIMADEPTGALDSHTGKEVLHFLQELNREGSTVILITHDNAIAATARRVVRISDGKIFEDYEQEVDWL